jgi:hypothetical protein
LFASALFGLTVIALLPAVLRFATRLLVGWDAGVALYLTLVYYLVAVSQVSHIRLRARIEDESKTATDTWIFGALKNGRQVRSEWKKYPLIAMGTPGPYLPPRLTPTPRSNNYRIEWGYWAPIAPKCCLSRSRASGKPGESS